MNDGQDPKTGRFLPGNSGCGGRPKGSRNKLGEEFISALHDDFVVHGVGIIEKVRMEQPAQYLRMIAAIVPRETIHTDATLADMSDDELMELFALLREAANTDRDKKGRGRVGAKRRDQEPRSKPH